MAEAGLSALERLTHLTPPAPPLTPASWMHRMRRETGGSGSLDGGVLSRRDSLQEPSGLSGGASGLPHQPSLTAVALGRPQTAAPHTSAGGAGSAGAERPGSEWQGSKVAAGLSTGGTEFSEAIREEPPSPSAAAGANGSKAALLPALSHSPQGIRAVRPSTALPSGAASPGKESPARRSSLAP